MNAYEKSVVRCWCSDTVCKVLCFFVHVAQPKFLVQAAESSVQQPQEEDRFSTSWANELKYLLARNFKLMFRYESCAAKEAGNGVVFLFALHKI